MHISKMYPKMIMSLRRPMGASLASLSLADFLLPTVSYTVIQQESIPNALRFLTHPVVATRGSTPSLPIGTSLHPDRSA